MKKLLKIMPLLVLLFVFFTCSSKKTSEQQTEPVPEPQPIPQPQPQPEPVPDPNINNPYIYIQDGQFYFQGKKFAFKGVNYFPVQRSWKKMWAEWQPMIIEKELDLLQSVGVNVIRIFLDYNEFEKQRERVGEWSIMLARLDELLLYLDKRGMRALPTLFVWGHSPKIANDKAHIDNIVKRFKDDRRIFGWDISNELDHGWADKIEFRSDIQNWAAEIFKYLKTIDSNHLVTVGDYGHYLGDRADWQGSGISLDISKMSVLPELQDFICFHWYGHPAALDIAFQKLASLGKPVIVEEIGLPTGGKKNGSAWTITESQVGDYYRAWMIAAHTNKAYIMPWCGFDYDPAFAPFPPDSVELFFGLFAKDYRLKANGLAFRDNYIAPTLPRGYMLAPLPELKINQRSRLR